VAALILEQERAKAQLADNLAGINVSKEKEKK
jgi:hypothetical protein